MAEAKMTMEVGKNLDTFLAEVGDRWEAAAAGEAVEPTSRIVFRDWNALYAALTPKRMELLAQLRSAPAEGVRSLARALDRDVKRVHSDVVALEGLGLVSRDEAGVITLQVDEIQSTIRIGASSTTGRAA